MAAGLFGRAEKEREIAIISETRIEGFIEIDRVHIPVEIILLEESASIIAATMQVFVSSSSSMPTPMSSSTYTSSLGPLPSSASLDLLTYAPVPADDGRTASYVLCSVDDVTPTPVKTEASASPELSPVPASLHDFQFQFNPHHYSSASHDNPTLLPQQRPKIYHFGFPSSSSTAINNSYYNHHHISLTPATSAATATTTTTTAITSAAMPANPWASSSRLSLNTTGLDHSMAYSDDYDDTADMIDMPMSAGYNGLSTSPTAANQEKRRRSSKGARGVWQLLSRGGAAHGLSFTPFTPAVCCSIYTMISKKNRAFPIHPSNNRCGRHNSLRPMPKIEMQV